MKYNLKLLPRLFLGFFVCSVGIVMTINANLGLAPWDVLHQGVANLMGITIGKANIVLGVIIITINALFGENIGWGTVLNMIFIGIFIDFLMLNHLIPVFTHIVPRFLMMFLGMLTLGYGCVLYMGVGAGTGPRDGLMVGLTKRTGKSVRLIKNSVESSAVILGFFLGGTVGVGTAVMALTGGFFLQFAFKTANFDVTGVKHRYIVDDIKDIKG